MTLVYLVSAWLLGIVVNRQVDAPWWLYLVGALLFAVLAFIARRPDLRSAYDLSLAVGLASLSALCLGGMRHALTQGPLAPDHVSRQNDTEALALEGLIISQPDLRDTHTNLRVRVDSIELPDGAEQKASGVVLVQAPRDGEYRYGDPVRVFGVLETPPEFDTFSYRDYLARQDVYSIIRFASVRVTGPRQGNPLQAAILDFRESAHQTILRLLPDPGAALLSGILLGDESGISPEVRSAFSTVGATHVIAISGANLAILGGLLKATFSRFFKERVVLLLTILGVLSYAIFVGGEPAVMRAAVMVTLGLSAQLLGRETWGLASLFFAAWLMSIIEPRVLWDVGFQLSFLATLGLILYVEPMQIGLEHLLAFVFEGNTPRKIVGTVSDALLVTIAAQITTTPVMAYTFEQFSVLSLPVNLLIIPVQTPIMVLGGIGTALALLFAPLGQIVLWGSWLFITYSWWIIRSFAGLPLASVEVHPSAELTLTIYVVLFALTAVWKLRPTEREAVTMWMKQDFLPRFTAGSCAIFGILLLIGSWQVADGRLHMHFLNLNDGSATLIITPSGRHILVDTGNSPRQLSTGLGEILPFWDRRLDLVVITSSDRDHIGGLAPLLERFEVDAVLINQPPGEDAAEQTAWTALQSRQIPVIVGQLGTSVVVDDGVTLEVLYAQSNMNDSGEPLVITLNYGDARILLSGNMTETAERTLFSESWLLDSTVLLVPNGGDAEANPEKFIEAVHPQIAIIMVEASSRTGLPDLETLQRLEDSGALVIRSDEQGEIHIWTDGEYLWQRTSNP